MIDPATDPISSTGLALQTKTQGMTPPQVQQLAQQYEAQGLKSFNDIITLKNTLDALKQQASTQPPPATTVVQDMQGELSQQAQQRMQGVASLPVANVGNPQAYARGGIVSFAGGGTQLEMDLGPRQMEMDFGPEEAARRIKDAEAAAARVAAKEGRAAGQTVFRRMLGSAALRFPIKHPYITALLAAAPFAYDYFYGDAEETPEAEAPPEAAEPAAPEAMNLTDLLNEVRQNRMSSIDSNTAGAIGPYVDPTGQYAEQVAMGRKQIADTTPQEQSVIDAEMRARYAGKDDYLKQRETQLDERGERIEATHKPDFWNSVATGLFSMGKAGGQDGSSFFGAASEGGLAGMKDRLDRKNTYLSRKDALDDNRFETGQARSAFDMGLLGKGEAKRTEQENRYDKAQADYKNTLDARAEAVVRSILIQEAMVQVGAAQGPESVAFKQLQETANRITGSTTAGGYGADIRAQIAAEKAAAEEEGLLGIGGPHGSKKGEYTVVGRTPVKQ